MRIVCPTSSSLNLDSSLSVSGFVAPSRPNDPPPPQPKEKRSRTLDRTVKFAKVDEAWKKHNMKQRAHQKEQVRPILNHIYVGNLDNTITVGKLKQIFGHCGQIQHIEIRCSRGRPVSVPIPDPGPRDRRYATIQFCNPHSVIKALDIHGTMFEGYQLVVSVSAGALPEVVDIAQERLRSMPRPNTQNPYPETSNKQVVRAPTEKFLDCDNPANWNNRILGISFATTIA